MMHAKKLRLVAAIATVGFIAYACGGDDTPSTSTDTDRGDDATAGDDQNGDQPVEHSGGNDIYGGLGEDGQPEAAYLDGLDFSAPTVSPDTKKFDAERELKYQLPFPYRETLAVTKRALLVYENSYLGDPASPKGKTVLDTRYRDCRTKEVMKKWENRYTFHMFMPLAEVFYACMAIFKDDPLEPEVAGQCREALLKIADHTIKHANASEFYGFTVKGADGKPKRPMGWNNMPSAWDAWANKSCSSSLAPSAWATGSALNVLGLAASISPDPKYKDAIKEAMTYLHQSRSVDLKKFTKSPEAIKIAAFYLAKQKAKTFANYVTTPTYTIGASRFKLASAGTTGQKATLFYHYKGEVDPARNTINTNATMAQALLYASIVDPKTKFPIAKVDGGFVPMTYRDISTRVIFPIHGNLAKANYTYVDLDDMGYNPKSPMDEHLLGTIGHLARIGALTKNKYFTEVAVKATLAVEAMKLPLNAANVRAACMLRMESPQLREACKRGLATTPAKQRHFLWTIYGATVLPTIWKP